MSLKFNRTAERNSPEKHTLFVYFLFLGSDEFKSLNDVAESYLH